MRPKTKEESDLETLHSWMEVGGFQLGQRKRHRGF